MSKRDYYEVLGVDRGVDAAALKKAYRRVAMKNHPDRNPDNPDAENIFKEANEAFEVLSDKDKRARYDQYGHAGVDGQTSAGGADFGDMFGGNKVGRLRQHCVQYLIMIVSHYLSLVIFERYDLIASHPGLSYYKVLALHWWKDLCFLFG